MNLRDPESKHLEDRTEEQRRFLLWSIARANPKRTPGPYIDGSRPEIQRRLPHEPSARSIKRVFSHQKGPRYYRKLLLSGSARLGAISGALIGFNIGLFACFDAETLVEKALVVVLPTVLCGLLGLTLAWAHVLEKRTDLFGYRYPLCNLCPWRNR